MIQCRTLGSIEVSVDGSPAPPELLWRKHLALLVYLARSPRQARSREHLIGMLWGDRTETAARHSLSEALRVIRRHAGLAAVELTVGQVRLVPGSVELDVDRLEQLIADEDWAGASDVAGGEFLDGFAVPDASGFEDWLATERDLWRRRTVDALVGAAEALCRVGRPQNAGVLAGRALAIEPTSEPALRSALRCLTLSGDRAGGLELFDRFCVRIAELGLEPGAETLTLVDRVRRGRRRSMESQAAYIHDPSVVRPSLVAREEELSRLLEGAARSARSRKACLFLLEGQSGVGKTRLLEEMLGLVRLDGMSVTTARTVEADRTEPWSGVLALARGGIMDAPGVGAAPAAALVAFAELLPEWAERFRGAAAPDALPLGRALAEILRAAAEEQPVAVALDDAQWLDTDSALALGAALRDLAEAPLTMVLATAPYPPRPELDELRTRIGRDFEGGAVRLRTLDRAAIRGLAQQILPGYDADALERVVRRVATDSAGLPLLAVEVLRAVALGLDLGTISGAWPEPLRTLDQSLPGDLPDAVAAAIRIGFRRVSPASQSVLLAAAVLGDLTTPALIERALGLDSKEVDRALDELEWHRWLLSEPRGYSFVARIVRQVVERDIVTPGQRRRLQEAAGRGLDSA